MIDFREGNNINFDVRCDICGYKMAFKDMDTMNDIDKVGVFKNVAFFCKNNKCHRIETVRC